MTIQELTQEQIFNAPLVRKHKDMLSAFLENGATVREIVQFLNYQTSKEGACNAAIIVAWIEHRDGG